eukprot:9680786-Lingulodinium_polyedra.AAC.1
MRAAEITAACERPNQASGLSSSPTTTRWHEAWQFCRCSSRRCTSEPLTLMARTTDGSALSLNLR